MPPTLHIRLSGLGTTPCNASSIGDDSCILTLLLRNLTMGNSGDSRGGSSALKDDEGAMKFIIVVLLVYSLVGTAGMLILRIRQSTTRGHKNKVMKDANYYLKHRHRMSNECHKENRLLETNRVLRRLESLERQNSGPESPSLSAIVEDPSTPSSPAKYQSHCHTDSQWCPVPGSTKCSSLPSSRQESDRQVNPWVFPTREHVSHALAADRQQISLFTAPLMDAATYSLLPLALVGKPDWGYSSKTIETESKNMPPAEIDEQVKKAQAEPEEEDMNYDVALGERDTLLAGSKNSKTKDQDLSNITECS